MVLSDEKPVVTEIFGTTGPVDDCSQGRGVGMFSSPGGAAASRESVRPVQQ